MSAPPQTAVEPIDLEKVSHRRPQMQIGDVANIQQRGSNDSRHEDGQTEDGLTHHHQCATLSLTDR